MNETSINFVDSEARAPVPLSSPERALSAANLSEAIDEIKQWATEQGLRGATARDLFEGYCRRLEAHGFALMRAYVSTQTLHPQWTATATLGSANGKRCASSNLRAAGPCHRNGWQAPSTR